MHRLFEAPKQKLMSPVGNFVLRIKYRRKSYVCMIDTLVIFPAALKIFGFGIVIYQRTEDELSLHDEFKIQVPPLEFLFIQKGLRSPPRAFK